MKTQPYFYHNYEFLANCFQNWRITTNAIFELNYLRRHNSSIKKKTIRILRIQILKNFHSIIVVGSSTNADYIQNTQLYIVL